MKFLKIFSSKIHLKWIDTIEKSKNNLTTSKKNTHVSGFEGFYLDTLSLIIEALSILSLNRLIKT